MRKTLSYLVILLLLAGILQISGVQAQGQPNPVWLKTFGLPDEDRANSISLSGAGDLYVAGRCELSDGNFEAVVAKLDSDGNLQWCKRWGGSDYDEAKAVILDGSKLWVAGKTQSYSINGDNKNTFIAKLNTADGGLELSKVWRFTEIESGDDVWSEITNYDQTLTGATLLGGNLYVGGVFQGVLASDYGYYVLKFASDGSLKWAKCIGLSKVSKSDKLALAAYGSSIYVAGDLEAIVKDGVIAEVSVFLAKLDESGDMEWVVAWPEGGDSISLYDVAAGSDGIYVVGKVYTQNAYVEAFVAKFSSDGNLQWAEYFGTDRAEYAYGVALDGQGGVYIAGRTGTNSGGFLVKLDSNGNIQWCVNISGDDVNNYLLKAASGQNVVYAVGYTDSSYESLNTAPINMTVSYRTENASDLSIIKRYDGEAPDFEAEDAVWVHNLHIESQSTGSVQDVTLNVNNVQDVDWLVVKFSTQDLSPPNISNVTVTPSSGEIGTVFTITATVTDNSGVSFVRALIQHPDETTIATVNLQNSGGNTWSGSWNSSGSPAGTYYIDLEAEDSVGNLGESENVATITLTVKVVILTPEQKEAIKEAKKVVEEIDEKGEVDLGRVEEAFEKLVENNLISKPTFTFTPETAQKLFERLQEIYGPNLEKYPTPEGRIWLLYMLTKSQQR